jgi:uncharacterized membrane protein HdeD (DUF308 family)
MSAPVSPPPPAQRARLKKQMLALGFTLIIGGLVVLAFLTRIPLPLRLAVGLIDLIAGSVLLLAARQKFSR